MVKKKSKRWRGIGKYLVVLGLVLALVSLLPVVAFRWIDPPSSMVIWQRGLSEGVEQTHIWVSFEAISPHMAMAVIAAEDQKFPVHNGFDTQAMLEALQQRMAGKRLRGASTLTQQVAKNLFLWQGRSLLRKGLEAWYTAWMELLWSKQRILEVYLNIAETGPRLFGMEAAGQAYFGVKAANLTIHQAALIAAVLPNPVRYNVHNPDKRVRKKQQWIIKQMRNLGGTKYLRKL